VINVNTSQYYR